MYFEEKSAKWIMTEKEFQEWTAEYKRVMNDPTSSAELIMMTNQFNNQIAVR